MLQVIQEEVEDDSTIKKDKKLQKDFTEKFEQKFPFTSALEECCQEVEKYYMENSNKMTILLALKTFLPRQAIGIQSLA